jgi:hypothetical protein
MKTTNKKKSTGSYLLLPKVAKFGSFYRVVFASFFQPRKVLIQYKQKKRKSSKEASKMKLER